MQLIDGTLSLLDEKKPDKHQILKFIEYGMMSGITCFQISPYIMKTINSVLPLGGTYFMELDLLEHSSRYPNVQHFFVQKIIDSACITKLQLNDVREIIQLRNYKSTQEVLLAGFDDLLVFEYRKAFRDILSSFDANNIIFSPEDQFNLASATALCFIKAGGKRLLTSFTGIGNKAATEQVLLALHLFCRYKVNQSFDALSKMKTWMEEVCGEKIPEKMPIIGERIFWVESGIHVDGIMKNPSNYEPYPPELVGQQRKIVIGKYSGQNAIRLKLQELGFCQVSDEICEEILREAKETSIRKGSYLSEQEFYEVVGKLL